MCVVGSDKSGERVVCACLLTCLCPLLQAQQLITKATEKCYAKCVTSPSTSLSSKEEKCLGSCLERYFEAFNLVSNTYVRRISEQRGSLGAAAE